jgi:hypothetical protein
LKNELIEVLKLMKLSYIVIRFDYASETAEFANAIGQFLKDNDYCVFTNGVLVSDIEVNEFSVQRNPIDHSFAILRIGVDK